MSPAKKEERVATSRDHFHDVSNFEEDGGDT